MQTQHIALALFLILLTIGAIILLSILIIVKRRIARRKSRIGRSNYIPSSYKLPKVWKESIEKKIAATVKIRTEPQVFGQSYVDNFEEYISNGSITFLYRAKAVDEFLKLKCSILMVDPTLEAPPLRHIRDFLLSARHHAMSPPASRDKVEEYCNLYLWARHDLNPFGKSEYECFCKLQSNLMELVSRASVIRTNTNSGVADTSTNGQSIKLTLRRRLAPLLPINLFTCGRKSTRTTNSPSGYKPAGTGKQLKSDQTRLTRPKVVPKTNPGSLALKCLTHRQKHELLESQSDNEPQSSTQPRNNQIFSNEVGDLDSSVELSTVINRGTGISRRGSCQSDGSQTALIDLEPTNSGNTMISTYNNNSSSIINPKPTTQSSKPFALDDSYLQSKLKVGPRYIRCMENEGANC